MVRNKFFHRPTWKDERTQEMLMLHQIKWLWDNIDANLHRRHILALIICVITCGLTLVNPALTQKLVDDVIVAQNPEPLLKLLAIMLVVQGVRLGLRYYMIITMERDAQNLVYNLRCRLFTRLQYNDMAFFDRNRAGDLMTRLSADLDWCRHFTSYIDYRIIDSVCVFLFTTIYLFCVSWKLTLLLVIVTPMLMLITKLYSSHVRPRFIAMRDRLSEMNTAAQENIAGNRVVKAFAREEYEKEQFDKRNQAFMESNLSINKLWLSFFPFIELLANAMMLITVFVGGLFIIAGEITPGQLAVFTSLSWALSNPMRELGNLLNDLQRFSTSAQKVMEVYYAAPHIVDAPDAEDRGRMEGRIEFRHVSYRLDGKTIIDDVSFTVEPGQTVAVMGPTGSGKTTLINLLERFYDVSDGEILVDGVNVKDWKLQQLRGGIGTATQDVFLFSDTVDGNIAFGNQNLSEAEVKDFARRAAAGDFIEKLADGYETIIGERGVGLSGGQRQRIALARALAVKPSILVMDDTTSAVDSETEQYMQQQLRQLPFPCTKFIIAQRVSSMRDADLILVLKDGRVAERGTHEELVRSHGYYYQTYALQNGLTEEVE